MDNTSYVNQLYQSILGRTADPGGLEHWTKALNTGRMSPNEVETYFYGSPEYQNLLNSKSSSTKSSSSKSSKSSSGGGGGSSSGTEEPGFNIPTDAYPYTGIDWSNPLLTEIQNTLLGKIDTLESDIDKFSQAAEEKYANLMKNALGPQMFQATLEDYGARNMISSDFSKDALATVTKDIMKAIGDKAFDTQMQIAGAKTEIPERLGQLATLGQVSTNKLAPYQIMAQMIMAT